MTDLRCYQCRSLLAKINLDEGRIEIKCPKCNAINVREQLSAVGRPVRGPWIPLVDA